MVLRSLPFVFARAIRDLFEGYIRFGYELIRTYDPELVQLHQFVFIELIGFRVDSIYILNQLQ